MNFWGGSLPGSIRYRDDPFGWKFQVERLLRFLVLVGGAL
jgi:hypothetical protein